MLVNHHKLLKRRRIHRVSSSLRQVPPLNATLDENLQQSIAHQLQTISVEIETNKSN
ncbi:MAG: hypothetical protein RMX68_013920 [Aulosira sp. ZfuVER01]|nr:hypothetical protein [Aulosira sp. DedVER01a]MDZ8053449.1 hypothetical protein [Aulosira sp. ZfuCHP01]